MVVGEHHRGVTRWELVILWAHCWAAPAGSPKTCISFLDYPAVPPKTLCE